MERFLGPKRLALRYVAFEPRLSVTTWESPRGFGASAAPARLDEKSPEKSPPTKRNDGAEAAVCCSISCIAHRTHDAVSRCRFLRRLELRA
jgi:hypothetical protein